MTLFVEIIGWLAVIGGFPVFMRTGSAGLSIAGAATLGLAYAGAFNI